ncbi:hypothetical protein COB55_01730 [Candidatus Wolfebacteria bacterium]|nr:MAG: hypothetical protein COB55_01730 [Candidatus Wolfebacteria bacterium]
MKNTSKFQLIFLAILLVFAVIGVAIFALSGGGSQTTEEGGTAGPVYVWGTFDGGVINDLIKAVKVENKEFDVTYTELPENGFDRQVVEAIASGNGPDAILVPQSFLGRFSDKLQPLSYEFISERSFRDAYIDGAEIYLGVDGISGMPVAVDPLVMYWNRDLVAAAGLPRQPITWEEFRSVVSRLTKYHSTGSITQSGVAFGTYDNILHAKDILSTLILQTGNSLVAMEGGKYKSILARSSSAVSSPSESALTFYTEFSDPVKPTYSWNLSLAEDLSRFVSGDLALYFGYASELPEIQKRNPNLNFDVASIPQPEDTNSPRVFGNIFALMLLKTANNTPGAVVAMQSLSSQSASVFISGATVLPPVQRSLLAVPQTNSFDPVFYDSALITHGWYDPNPSDSNRIFRDMIQSVISGRVRTSRAVRTADGELNSLLN